MSKKRKPSGYPCTDTGNAECIAALFGDVLRYEHRQGRWIIWDKRSHRWSEDRAGEIRKYAITAARYRRKVAARLADTDKSKREIRWAFESEHCRRLDAALEVSKSLPPISDSGESWDANSWLFGVANGVIDLRTGKIRDEQPGDLITKHSPVRYDPGAECPRFERFLKEIFNHDEPSISYMHRAIGYYLTGSIQEHCVFCWYGSGANGKTTLQTVLRHILGDFAVNLPFSALEMKVRNSNDLVALAGARFATAAETNESVRLNEARIKVLTGGDPITGRHLYHESFTFDPTHKLVLAFNHKPVIADDSEGMWRRVHLIPFTRMFKLEEQDKNLLEALKSESPGILALAVRGSLIWQEEGLGMPPAFEEATAAYREESDNLGQFIEDCCVVGPTESVTSSQLWGAYQEWEKRCDGTVINRNAFADRLKRRGFSSEEVGHDKRRVWRGLALRTESDAGARVDAGTDSQDSPTISPPYRSFGNGHAQAPAHPQTEREGTPTDGTRKAARTDIEHEDIDAAIREGLRRAAFTR